MTSAPEADLIVRCAECATSYRLPLVLLGGRGARVRCRECGARFDVLRDASGESARAIAQGAVERLEQHAPRLADAGDRGRLFAEAGSLVLEAWDDYRRRAGSGAPSGPFRDALRQRFGLDLPGGDDARATGFRGDASRRHDTSRVDRTLDAGETPGGGAPQGRP